MRRRWREGQWGRGGRWEEGNGEGGKGERGGDGEWAKKGQEEGDFTNGYDGMHGRT